ncbi:MAG: hypothetical protein KY464_02520 [Gemmatimonadetes bacterium]|nr:hypothetical protein [Gemmatimonadota bacterium]
MADRTPEEIAEEDRNRRGADRRGDDRRRPDRRAPRPLWKRPWAYALYGVVGTFLVVMIFRSSGEDEAPAMGEVTTAPIAPAVDTTASPAAAAPPREALGTGEYERLLAQGDAASGQRVITQLYCEPVNSISMSVETAVSKSVAAVADVNGRVPGAECKWGAAVDAPDLLLLVPPDLAPAFAGAPEVQQSFVRRRSVRAEVEWIGRSDALALRNVAVLRGLR